MLRATPIGIDKAWSKPKALACLRISFWPNRSPSPPKAVLHDTRNASARLMSPPPLHCSPWKFCSLWVVCGRDSSFGAGSCDDGLKRPLESAAAVVITLKVDPGG